MNNTINLLPSKSKEQIKKDSKKFTYDFVTAVIILIVVFTGIATILINSVLTYNASQQTSYVKEATSTLDSYRTLAAQYASISERVQRVHAVQADRLNPTDVLQYIVSIVPGDMTLSNFSLDTADDYQVTISSPNYISVAKLLVTLENPSLRLNQTELNQITYNSNTNVFDFQVSGVYVPPANG